MACYQAYTHRDLDGAVSLLTLLWALPDDFVKWKSFNNLQVDNIKSELQEVNNPCSTFILDLSLRQEFLPDLDLSYITFIDHHESSEPFISEFKNAKIIHKTISSNALLMSSIFKGDKYPVRTDAQKMMIALADDFDCYRLQLPQSYDLNILFWSEYKNDFSRFIKDYFNGFKPFTPEQKKAISFIKRLAEQQANELPIYKGEINFGSKKKNVLAVMGENYNNLVCDLLMLKHQPDIFFFINSKSEKVSIRQYSKEDPINIGTFAEKICDGGGHKHAGGGVITPLFMEVTKNLKPVKI